MENIQCINNGVTWYDKTCNVLGLKHHLHSPLDKSLMERVNQYFKDIIECFADHSLHAYRKIIDVIYFVFITGYNSLFQCIAIQYTRMNLLLI